MSYDANQKKLIELALQDILQSQGFTNSTQLSNFLSFIVTKTLDDKTNEIKGYTIGVDALGRSEDFDPQVDPSVRVMAGRLRQSLENYNRDTGGFTKDGTTVQLKLVKGSYVPSISFLDENEETKKPHKDKLAALEDTDIDIGLDKVKPIKTTSKSTDKTKAFMFASVGALALLAGGIIGFNYYQEHTRIEPTVLPEKKTITIENSELPSLTLFINANPELIPDWISSEKIASTAVVAFSRFNEYRIFNFNNENDLVFMDAIESDYYLSMYFSTASDKETLEGFVTLTRPPESEVVWSDKLGFPKSEGEQTVENIEKISTITSAIMSPYGIIHGDITSNENPPPKLDCIRAIYSYFAKEDLQAYANGLDCARRSTSSPIASSSMYAMLTFLYVEAFRKQIIEVSQSPLDDAREYAKKAITLDPRNARAFQGLFAVEKTSGNKEEAIAAATQALALNPFDRDILGDYAAYLVSINEQETAEPILQQAIKLTPVLPAWLAFYDFLHADVTGNFAKADRLAEKFKAEDSSLLAAAIILSASRNNDTQRVTDAVNKINILEPGFAANPASALLRRGFDEDFAEEIALRLQDAGLSKHIESN